MKHSHATHLKYRAKFETGSQLFETRRAKLMAQMEAIQTKLQDLAAEENSAMSLMQNDYDRELSEARAADYAERDSESQATEAVEVATPKATPKPAPKTPVKKATAKKATTK